MEHLIRIHKHTRPHGSMKGFNCFTSPHFAGVKQLLKANCQYGWANNLIFALINAKLSNILCCLTLLEAPIEM